MRECGWGRVDIHKLRELLQLHTAHEDISGRTSYIAERSLQSSSAHSSVDAAGSLSAAGCRRGWKARRPTSHPRRPRYKFANISGALGLNWLVDGRPMTRLRWSVGLRIMEEAGAEEFSVRTYYMRRPSTRCAMPRRLASESSEVFQCLCPAAARTTSPVGGRRFSIIHAGIDPTFVK